MPIYSYRAIDSVSHKTLEGQFEAENYRAAKEMLREQGQIPTQLEEEQSAAKVEDLMQQIPVLGSLFAPKIGLKPLNIFTQQLTTLVESGIPLIEALFLLEQQTTNQRLRQVLKKVRTDVIAGDSFSTALSRFPNDFSNLYINLIRAGEVSGELDRILGRISDLLEKYLHLRQKIQQALLYPAFTIVVIVIVIGIIMYFVVPQFQNLFASNGAELPLPTQILIACSNFFVSFWWLLGIGTASFGIWFNFFRQSSFGKPIVDQWLLTLPLLGDVINKIYVTRFIRTLSTVLASGIPLTEGLAISSATVDNKVHQVSYDKARESLLMGGTLGRPLEKTNLFPLMVTKMIAIGEETGEMEKMMNKSADFLEMEVDQGIETMTTMIEPIMIVVLGTILLGVALALYIPLFDMGKVVSGH